MRMSAWNMHLLWVECLLDDERTRLRITRLWIQDIQTHIFIAQIYLSKLDIMRVEIPRSYKAVFTW